MHPQVWTKLKSDSLFFASFTTQSDPVLQKSQSEAQAFPHQNHVDAVHVTGIASDQKLATDGIG